MLPKCPQITIVAISPNVPEDRQGLQDGPGEDDHRAGQQRAASPRTRTAVAAVAFGSGVATWWIQKKWVRCRVHA